MYFKKNVTEALEKAAEAGRPYPMLYIGKTYCSGYGFIKKNEKKGLNYLRKAAEYNCLAAIAYIGEFYKKGKHGLKKDITLGNKYLKIAADAGNGYAKKELSKLV